MVEKYYFLKSKNSLEVVWPTAGKFAVKMDKLQWVSRGLESFRKFFLVQNVLAQNTRCCLPPTTFEKNETTNTFNEAPSEKYVIFCGNFKVT